MQLSLTSKHHAQETHLVTQRKLGRRAGHGSCSLAHCGVAGLCRIFGMFRECEYISKGEEKEKAQVPWGYQLSRSCAVLA